MFTPLAEIDAEDVERLLAVNVEAALWLARAALPAMLERGYGRIVFTVSKHGLSRAGARDLAAYSVGKASQAGLTYALADETEGTGVLVNAIAPIAVTRTSRRTPPPDEFTVAQVAPAVAFLASSACTHSGVIVHAENGRFSAGRYLVNAGVDMGRAPTTPEAFRDRWDEVIGEP
jgi:NAD(P)-dependent dehydrogenase (short-subunit alcohol dehydrogenase family)